MKDVFLVYDTSCFYEIIILNYFMSYAKCEVLLCSPDGKPVRSQEGVSVNVDAALEEINTNEIRSFIVPGGNVSAINHERVWNLLRELKVQNKLIAGICAGVDVLDDAGILKGLKSTHSTDADVVNDDRVITARANGYVDFAIEVAKTLGLFENDEDINETIRFWKNHNRVQ